MHGLALRCVPVLSAGSGDAYLANWKHQADPKLIEGRCARQGARAMTTKASYTDEEWALLKSSMVTVGAAVLAATNSGLIGKLRKFATLYGCLKMNHVPEAFEQNELVRALLQDFHAMTSSPLSASARTEITRARGDAAAAQHVMLADCGRVAAVLRAKAPQAEADGVKRWLMWIARSVASADDDGRLGAGPTINGAEAQVLEQIALALHAPPGPASSEHGPPHRNALPTTGTS
jgi:hypothetical protein